jgi:hypothetical protein
VLGCWLACPSPRFWAVRCARSILAKTRRPDSFHPRVNSAPPHLLRFWSPQWQHPTLHRLPPDPPACSTTSMIIPGNQHLRRPLLLPPAEIRRRSPSSPYLEIPWKHPSFSVAGGAWNRCRIITPPSPSRREDTIIRSSPDSSNPDTWSSSAAAPWTPAWYCVPLDLLPWALDQGLDGMNAPPSPLSAPVSMEVTTLRLHNPSSPPVLVGCVVCVIACGACGRACLLGVRAWLICCRDLDASRFVFIVYVLVKLGHCTVWLWPVHAVSTMMLADICIVKDLLWFNSVSYDPEIMSLFISSHFF